MFVNFKNLINLPIFLFGGQKLIKSFWFPFIYSNASLSQIGHLIDFSLISSTFLALGFATTLTLNQAVFAAPSKAVPQVNWTSLKKAHWSAEELANVKVVSDFVQHLMNDHDFEYIRANFKTGSYIQHNRSMEDGIEGVIKYLKPLVQLYPEYSYNVKRIMVDGDLVNFHSHVTLKSEHRENQQEGFNIYDTWRVKNGNIVEHWDALQPLDPFMRFLFWIQGGEIKNNNGSF